MPDIGSLVSFRISDAYLPGPEEVLDDLNEENVLQGRLIDISDCGSAKDVFGVVELRDGQTVVVAVEHLNSPGSGASR